MAFDWLTSTGGLPASIRSARRQTMYRTELAERAALLRRLNYPRDRAKRRLAANVAWDFEIGAADAPSSKEIDAVVASAYGK